jgi:hypothetical protein
MGAEGMGLKDQKKILRAHQTNRRELQKKMKANFFR